MTYILYHYPGCSKSRACLQLLLNNNICFKKRLYIKDPLNFGEISELVERFSGNLENLFRENKKIGFNIKNKLLVKKFFFKNQCQLQRPIFYNGKNFTVCRPPKKVLDLITT